MSSTPPPPSISAAPDSLLLSPFPPDLVGSPPSLGDLPPDVHLPGNVRFFEPDAALRALAGLQQSSFLTPALPRLDFNATQQQQLGVVDDLVLQQQQQQRVSTPTMHPNLVSTLKSIISPLPSSQSLNRLEQQEEHAQGPPSHGYKSICSTQDSIARLVDGPSPAFGLKELYTASFKQPDEQSQAAVVPVDVIRNRRPFRCAFPGCNKTFKNPQTLKMHHKTHYSEDSAYPKGLHSLATFPPSCKAGHNKKIPSKCPVCKRTFVGLYELRRHFGRKHSEGEKSHGCKKCGKKFYIEVDLRDHEKLCGEPLECKCGMKFAFKCNLVAHKKTHPDCQDSSEEGGGTGHGSSTCKIPSRRSALEVPATVSPSVFPSSQPPTTCALAASLLTPSSLHSLSHTALRKPFRAESVNLALRPDVKSEDVTFSWFPSAILEVGPMV